MCFGPRQYPSLPEGGGIPGLNVLVALARGMEVSLDWLVSDDVGAAARVPLAAYSPPPVELAILRWASVIKEAPSLPLDAFLEGWYARCLSPGELTRRGQVGVGFVAGWRAAHEALAARGTKKGA